MDNIREEHENKTYISDKILKDLKYDKETMMDQIEGQERLLDLLYDDIDRKNKEIDDLKKLVQKGVSNEEKTTFKKKIKQFLNLCKELDDKIEKRNKEFENLKVSIERLALKNAEPKEKCKYKWKCKSVVCRFDHSYLKCKINSFPRKPISMNRCDFCDKTFQSEAHLVAHKKRCHGNDHVNAEKYIHCIVCKEKFDSKSNMENHVRRVHSNEHFECTKCGKYFVTVKEVEDHMKKHDEDEKFAKNMTSKIEAVMKKTGNVNLMEPSTMSKPKSQKKEPRTKKKPAKKLRKPVKFEVIEEDLSDDSLAESGGVIEEDLSDDSLAESDDTNKSEISKYEDSSSEEESGGEYDEDIPDAVQ